MSRTHFIVIPWLVLGGAVALAGTMRWVEPDARPLDVDNSRPGPAWKLTVTTVDSAPAATAMAPPPATVKRQVTQRQPVAEAPAIQHARGEAVTRVHAQDWEKLARDGQRDSDVGGLALDARLEGLQSDLRYVAQLSSEKSGPAARKAGVDAQRLLEQVGRWRDGQAASPDQVEQLRSNVADLRLRAESL